MFEISPLARNGQGFTCHSSTSQRLATTRLPCFDASRGRVESRYAGRVHAAAGRDANVEVMRKFSEQYARVSDTYFCSDKSVTAVVIQGLAEHKRTLGAPLCPCRHYENKQAEAKQGYWNCPCAPMRERHECHCLLFLTPDSPFCGTERTISADEVAAVADEARGA